MTVPFHHRFWFFWTLIFMSMFWCHFWAFSQISQMYVKVFPADSSSFVLEIVWQCWVIREDLMIVLCCALKAIADRRTDIVLLWCTDFSSVSTNPLDLKEPMTTVTTLDENYMTETANISFFTVFCKLFSMSIKNSTWTIAPQWTAHIVSTDLDKRRAAHYVDMLIMFSNLLWHVIIKKYGIWN